jgi:hypothetical protein
MVRRFRLQRGHEEQDLENPKAAVHSSLSNWASLLIFESLLVVYFLCMLCLLDS